MDRFDEMRGKTSSKSNSNNNTNDITGILPFPVTAFVVGQTQPQEGNITLKVHVPESATSVDVLVKNKGIPADVNDYNQKFTVNYGDTDTDIFLEPKNDGGYDNQYGFWLLSKNSNGRQTAFGKYNTKLIDFIYSKQVITVTSSIGNSSNLDVIVPVNDYIFLSSVSDSYKGIYLLDKSTKTITKLSSSGYNIKKVEYLGSGYYLLCQNDKNLAYTSTMGYIYNDGDGTLKNLNGYVTNGTSTAYDLSTIINDRSYVVFGGSNGICVWNKNSNSLRNMWITDYSTFTDTSSGLFITANNKPTKRFDGTNFANCTYQLIDEEATNNSDILIYTDPVGYQSFVTEDTFGKVYGYAATNHPLLYMGNNSFVEIRKSSNPKTPRYNFKMGRYMYYIDGGLYRYAEDGIELVCPAGGDSLDCEAVVFGSGYLVKKIDNKACICYCKSHPAGMDYYIDECQDVTAPTLSGTFIPFYDYVADDGTQKLYFSGSTSKTIFYLYFDENGKVQSHTVATDKYVIEFCQIGDILFAKGDTTSKAIYTIGTEDDVFTTLGTYKYYRNSTQMTQVDFIKDDDLVYIVQHYKNQYSSSYIGNTLIYDMTTGTVTTSTDKKGGIRLNWGYYYQPTEGKVYSYKGDDIITTTLTSATSSETDVCAGYVTTSRMTFVYMV